MGNEIKIGCEGTIYLDYKTITEFQGDIKKISKQNIEKLKNSIKEKFKAPFFVWKNNKTYFMLDGHQRKKALSELENEGYIIPELPAVEVFAKTKKEAKQIVLDLTSQHGSFELNKLQIYIQDYKLTQNNIVLRSNEIVISEQDKAWNPPKYEDIKEGDNINEITGYNLSSFWKDISNNNCEAYKYQIELPSQNKKVDIVKQKYSRTNLQEIERVIKTYMRHGDYFLENCCGWSTFGSTAKFLGFSGEGVDIWDTAINHSKEQIEAIPGKGKVIIKKMNGMALDYKDNTFDFVYCNPPFMDQEKYSGLNNDIADKDFNSFSEKFIKLMSENYRVLKENGLCVVTMNDYRVKGELIPLQKYVIDWAFVAGFRLHDFVVAEVLSTRIRLRKKDYMLKRAVKCHEYVIVFKKENK